MHNLQENIFDKFMKDCFFSNDIIKEKEEYEEDKKDYDDWYSEDRNMQELNRL